MPRRTPVSAAPPAPIQILKDRLQTAKFRERRLSLCPPAKCPLPLVRVHGGRTAVLDARVEAARQKNSTAIWTQTAGASNKRSL